MLINRANSITQRVTSLGLKIFRQYAFEMHLSFWILRTRKSRLQLGMFRIFFKKLYYNFYTRSDILIRTLCYYFLKYPVSGLSLVASLQGSKIEVSPVGHRPIRLVEVFYQDGFFLDSWGLSNTLSKLVSKLSPSSLRQCIQCTQMYHLTLKVQCRIITSSE